MTVEHNKCVASQAATEYDKEMILCKVPVFRPVAVKLLQLLAHEDPCIVSVAKLINSDPGFGAEVLTMANSAGYAMRNRVNTIERAIMVLGMERTRALTTKIALHGMVSAAGTNPAIDDCWLHSRAASLIAEWLAPFYRIHPDRACTAALMHDIGRLGLLAAEPKPYSALLGKTVGTNDDMLLAERLTFRVDHCEAGLWLTKTWGLPEEFSTVCSEHHLEKEQITDPFSDLVRLACSLAQTLGYKAAPMIEAIGLETLLTEIPTFSRRGSIDVSVLSARLAKELPPVPSLCVN
jgi:HD-like signal output (HDOD) protein